MELALHTSPMDAAGAVRNTLAHFRLAQFRFRLEASTHIALPPYKGSTFRGALGHALKGLVCVTGKDSCEPCLLRPRCVYPYLFESRPPEGATALRNNSDIPQPFVLVPPLTEQTDFQTGATFALELVLLGKAIDYLGYFILALERMGAQGVGRGRGTFKLLGVDVIQADHTAREIYSAQAPALKEIGPPLSMQQIACAQPVDNTHEITLDFVTPTRLTQDDKLVDLPEFHVLIRRLLGRLSSLSLFHHDTPLEIDFRALIEAAKGVTIAAHTLHWHDWERFSNRQQTRMKLGGVKGTVSYTGELEVFLPFLRLGAWTHVGKGTSFGLGRYRMVQMVQMVQQHDD
ncbi:MAG: CRISPR system precrRNA processing endoribonuclease RAMP protein Cas6 [Gammaproteobacteria bacterium]